VSADPPPDDPSAGSGVAVAPASAPSGEWARGGRPRRPPPGAESQRRYFLLFHYFAFPILLVNAAAQMIRFFRTPSIEEAWELLVAAALAGGLLAARAMARAAQNRVIRLEMRLRLSQLLPPELRARVDELTVAQLVGLHFASDAELPTLVRRCLAGELRTADDVEREVREWQTDALRA
jgi:Family of unknown function (DUF6526)